jgi:NAD(P) transhydrogenase subunit alpha
LLVAYGLKLTAVFNLQTYYMEAILTWIADNQQMIYIVILMIFVGIEVIGHVPSVLHTPLMSGANAIHGVVIIGAIIVMGKAEQHNYVALILGFLAVVLGTLNVVGGFVVTDRMLEMFKGKAKKSKSQVPSSKKLPNTKIQRRHLLGGIGICIHLKIWNLFEA